VAWIILKKEGMGGGDVKLLAAIGAWLGWKPVVGTIVLASLLGSIGGIGGIVYRRLRHGQAYQPLTHLIPFGPYLCVGFLFIFFAGLDPLYWLMERYQVWLDAHLLPR
jgi:leader peptidase (prepilin peptidase)/N-methyltransferase